MQRGKTSTFHEVIDHAKGIGIDPEKIKKAEAMLEQHKVIRRREAFEAEMRAFLENSDSDDLVACEEKQRQGLSYGVSDKVLAPLRDKIADLQLNTDLLEDEVAQAKLFLEICTRRFVRSAVKGRDVFWIDKLTGRRLKAVMYLDLVLKNIQVRNSKDEELGVLKFAEATAKRATNVDEIAETEVFTKLTEFDQSNAVAIMGPKEPWLLLEPSRRSQDEFVIAFTVLNGVGLEGTAARASIATNGKAKDEVQGNSPKVPLAVQKMKMKRSGSAASQQDLEEDGEESPVSPRSPKRRPTSSAELEEVPKAEKKEKRDKKEKKGKKERKDK